MIAFMDSSSECNSWWLPSFASRKVGADMEAKSWMSLVLAAADRFWMCGAMLATMASRAGYTALSFPLLVVIRVYIDCKTRSGGARGAGRAKNRQ